MQPDVVVDVGNTRVKWGRCESGRIVEAISLAPQSEAWDWQAEQWGSVTPRPAHWVIAGVEPDCSKRLTAWLANRGDRVKVIDSHKQLNIAVEVDEPARVGIDRLLSAVAALRYLGSGGSGLVVDVGSAVTVNLIQSKNRFLGGAILPGYRLMAQALRDYTAQLPLVEFTDELRPVRFPGTNTADAIRVGIQSAIEGVVSQIRASLPLDKGNPHWLFLTGGGAKMLQPSLEPVRILTGRVAFIPTLTLEGIRLTAEALP